MRKKEEKRKRKCTTANERFGVSRGVCSRRVQREFGSSLSVALGVNPRPNAKPPDVGCNAGQYGAEKNI